MNYPSGIKKTASSRKQTTIDSNLSHKNRGMTLEAELNESNEYYRDTNQAFIYKKPTPIKIVKVDYPSRDKTVIKEAYFATPSTTDYNGIYKGYYIDFEAKETKSKTSFALENIHPHQIQHLMKINEHGGIAFLIVRFTTLNETYLLMAEDFLDYINHTNKKSIPINIFREKAYQIKDGYQPRIHYLKIIDNLLEVKEHEEEK